MLNVRYNPYDGPSGKPLGKPPLLYSFRGFPFASLALERHSAATYTPDYVWRPTLREDAPVDIDRL